MEALIKIRPDELKQDLLDKIKSFIKNDDTTEIIIQVKEKLPVSSVEEDPAGYMHQLKNAIEDKAAGRTTVFTMDEFRQYVNDNFSQ